MKKTLLTLLLLSLGLTGCFYDPGRGYGHRGYGYGERGGHDRAEYQVDRGWRGNWVR